MAGRNLSTVYRQANEFKWEIKKKLWGQTKGQAKIWWAMAHPGTPLESPLL